MFLHKQELPAVVQEFVTSHIMPRAPTALSKFGIGFITPYLANGVSNAVSNYEPILKTFGVLDEADRIDLDKAKEAAMNALTNAGGKVMVSGYSADADDLNVLLEIAQRHATN